MVFLMLIGALIAAFQIDYWTSFFINVILVFIFLIISHYGNEKQQVSEIKLILNSTLT